ncbi:hypothetical protein JCM10213_006117 [Rhodosporidiobolus nylandii]
MQIPASQSAASLLLSSNTSHRFTTTCAALDSLLTPQVHASYSSTQPDKAPATGLGRGAALELLGPPGAGKTRVALGFVMGERFSEEGGEVLVVDDGSKVREVLNGVRYRRIDSTWMLVAFFNTLETWLAEHPRVNLVIVDSLTAHFRPHLDNSTRTLLADAIRTSLSTVCSAGKVSVVLTTSLSLKLFGPDHRPTTWSRDAEALLVPQIVERWLPESGGGTAAWRVLLFYSEGGERLARLVSSPNPAQAIDVAFTMDFLGPCDYPNGERPDTADADVAPAPT